jgi:ureidoglycolate dehydrogenase (NAD+)
MIHVDSEAILPLLRRTLADRDVDPVAIDHVVASLVQTSLRGIDSHGISLFPHYCRVVVAGRINRRPAIRLERTASGTTLVDGDYAFGHHAGAVAIDAAVAGAAETGIAAAGVRHSSHFGAAAYFGLRAAERGCIGFAFTNGNALMRAHNSTNRFFGTNPICCCAPMADESPLTVDMATSLGNWNKIKNASRLKQPIPDNWAYDQGGRLTTDPNAAHSLAPVGGYKGFGLAMMVEVLCALLPGAALSVDLPAMYTSPLDLRRNLGHFFLAIDISKFTPLEKFTRALQDMADRIRALPSAPEADNSMMVPGDPEKRAEALRRLHGIPIDPERFGEFLALSPDFEQTRLS